MKQYCLINTFYGKYFIGSLEDVIGSVFSLREKNGKLLAKCLYYNEIELPSYSDEWTEEQKTNDVLRTLAHMIMNNKYPEWQLFSKGD